MEYIYRERDSYQIRNWDRARGLKSRKKRKKKKKKRKTKT